MRANLAQREPQQLQKWDDTNIYQTIRAGRNGKTKYVLHDGPPYANGQIHIGHAVNKILKDIVSKVQLLEGKDMVYVPGWDCHGLPIEAKVEKTHGKAGLRVDATKFRQLCREFATREIAKQQVDFKRLGVIGDWENPYTTMQFAVEAETIRALGKVIAQGNFRRGEKPVHWCFDCRSALAEAEIEYEDKVSSAIDVAFRFSDQAALLGMLGIQGEQLPIEVVIWTTTAWTIPANRGLTFHPSYLYQAVACTHKGTPRLFVLAQDAIESCMQRWGIEQWRAVGTAQPGSQFEHATCQHPLYDRTALCMVGDFVSLDVGTGIVHAAPAYGSDDFVIGCRYQLPIDNPVQDNGVYRDNLPLFGGQHITKANPHIIEALSQAGALVLAEDYVHSYPHCWRHSTPTIQRATVQWFIDLTAHELGTRALRAIDEVHWVPEWSKQRMSGMLENRPDWCLSRQRSWGTPITVFYHKQTGQPHPRSVEFIETIAQRVEKEGVEAWFSLSADELLGAQAHDYAKSTDTVDVWFDSGVTHQTVLGLREDLQFPADIYLEGSDQHRGWFQSSLLTSMCINGTPPYRTVLTHGFVVDAQGRKMSKSLGNIVAPQDVINQWGADILRLWVSSADFKNEMSISDEILSHIAEAYRRIRNTIRFLLGNTHDFTLDKAIDLDDMVALDRWMMEQTAKLQQEVQSAYLNYNYAKVYQLIYHFCSIDLGSFYLDIIKDRLYTTAADRPPRLSAQTALLHMVHTLVRLIAPILTFTAEEIWQELGAEESTVMLSTWQPQPQVTAPQSQPVIWDTVLKTKNALNLFCEMMRNQNKEVKAFGSLLDIEATVYLDEEQLQALAPIGDELRFALLCSSVSLQPLTAAPRDALRSESFSGMACTIVPSSFDKCERCWHRTPCVGQSSTHPTLCSRCETNLGAGESRRFV